MTKEQKEARIFIKLGDDHYRICGITKTNRDNSLYFHFTPTTSNFLVAFSNYLQMPLFNNPMPLDSVDKVFNFKKIQSIKISLKQSGQVHFQFINENKKHFSGSYRGLAESKGYPICWIEFRDLNCFAIMSPSRSSDHIIDLQTQRNLFGIMFLYTENAQLPSSIAKKFCLSQISNIKSFRRANIQLHYALIDTSSTAGLSDMEFRVSGGLTDSNLGNIRGSKFFSFQINCLPNGHWVRIDDFKRRNPGYY